MVKTKQYLVRAGIPSSVKQRTKKPSIHRNDPMVFVDEQWKTGHSKIERDLMALQGKCPLMLTLARRQQGPNWI